MLMDILILKIPYFLELLVSEGIVLLLIKKFSVDLSTKYFLHVALVVKLDLLFLDLLLTISVISIIIA
jgi:hypothetical protein